MGCYLVGCDVGTSGAKSIIIDDEGHPLSNHYIEYPLVTKHPGWAEQNPDWYWNGVADTIYKCIEDAGIDARQIRGVCISALSPACILVDKRLRPLQDAHIWMDRRGVEQARWLTNQIGEEESFKRSGNPIDPYYGTVKLMWERDNRPELYKQAYKMLTAADYPVMKMTGKPVTDHTNASLFGLGYDIHHQKWDCDIIETIGLDRSLYPDTYPCKQIIGEVTKEAAARTGLKEGTPVVAGTADACATWIAGGAVNNGDMSLAMGTAGCMGFIQNNDQFTQKMISIVYPSSSDKPAFATLAAIVSCGALTRYFRDQFAHFERLAARELHMDVFDIMNLQAEKVPIGCDGLIVLPYFMGERTPIWDTYARGVVFGMSLMHTKGHLLRAFLEGASFALYQNFKYVKESGIKMNAPLIVGEGGARSRLWRQMISDVFDVPVAYMSDANGAPFGDAVLAGVATGVFKDLTITKDWVSLADRHEPNKQAHNQYMEYYQIYLRLYDQLRNEFRDMGELLLKNK